MLCRDCSTSPFHTLLPATSTTATSLGFIFDFSLLVLNNVVPMKGYLWQKLSLVRNTGLKTEEEEQRTCLKYCKNFWLVSSLSKL